MFYLVSFTGGQVFSWGQNQYGQLGLGMSGQSISTPHMIQTLQGVPFAQISAGGAHSFALTLSGAVFGWGRNKFGQLGLNDTNGGCWTKLRKTLSFTTGPTNYQRVLCRSFFPSPAEVPEVAASHLRLLWRRSHSCTNQVKLCTLWFLEDLDFSLTCTTSAIKMSLQPPTPYFIPSYYVSQRKMLLPHLSHNDSSYRENGKALKKLQLN